MPLTRWGEMSFATDRSMAVITNTSTSEFRAALVDLLQQIAAGIIANDPTIIAAAEEAVADALASTLALAKCVHFESGRVAYDGPNAPAATHYVLRIDGRWRTAAKPFPTPSSSRPAISWN